MKREYILTLLMCAVVGCLICMSGDARSGAMRGLALCENVIVPSLLPMLVLTNTIVTSRGVAIFERVLGRLFERVLHLPRCTVAAVVLGMVGGYPAGALLTHRLHTQGWIDDATAAVLMDFDFCGGAAFIVTAVGTACYGDVRIGLMLYAATLCSCIVICVMGAPFRPVPQSAAITADRSCFIDAMTTAVEVSARSIINMCMYIVLFSAIVGLLSVPGWMLPLLEISGGVCAADKLLPLPYCAFFLSFGGFCIHLQLVGILRDMGVGYIRFLLHRIVGALLSYAVMLGIRYACGSSAAVFSTVNPVSDRLSSVNTGLSVVLILGCAVLVLDIEGKKSKLLYS